MNKAAFKANEKYSKIYIWITGTDKYFYREYSLIHKILVMLY